jgi:predicted RNase H-like nuclease (RuvC/YqgF family)
MSTEKLLKAQTELDSLKKSLSDKDTEISQLRSDLDMARRDQTQSARSRDMEISQAQQAQQKESSRVRELEKQLQQKETERTAQIQGLQTELAALKAANEVRACV